jgi:predicted short-subunit dehydrogenase-like oxidoreductase (DUF2520 family)
MGRNARQMDVVVIGAGRAGTAVAVLLSRAGFRISAVAGGSSTAERASRYLPGVPVLAAAEAAASGDIVILGVPDGSIEPVAQQLAGYLRGRWVAHLSGALGLQALEPARRAGARSFLMHPLQTCPDVERAIARIPGSAVAITARDEQGFAFGEEIAAAMGGRPFRLADEDRALYHAAAVVASNHLVANEAVAERLFELAGVADARDAMMPLVRATVENIGAMGPGAALTGPAVRGDSGTIRRNLEALGSRAPETIPIYVQLAGAALELAANAGRISDEARRAVEEELARWR